MTRRVKNPPEVHRPRPHNHNRSSPSASRAEGRKDQVSRTQIPKKSRRMRPLRRKETEDTTKSDIERTMKKEMERKRLMKRRSQMESEGGGVLRGLQRVGRPPPDPLQEGSGDTSLQ